MVFCSLAILISRPFPGLISSLVLDFRLLFQQRRQNGGRWRGYWFVRQFRRRLWSGNLCYLANIRFTVFKIIFIVRITVWSVVIHSHTNFYFPCNQQSVTRPLHLCLFANSANMNGIFNKFELINHFSCFITKLTHVFDWK